jgi:hypothetical protein
MPKRSTHCLNCGAPVPGNFCGDCGQRNADYRVSLREVLVEALDGLFQVDSRIMRTVPRFLFCPWILTRAYNAGRRTRYTSPLRLYLLLSVAYFFALPLARLSVPDMKLDVAAQAEAPAEKKVEKLHVHTGSKALDSRIQVQLDRLLKMDRHEAFKQVVSAFMAQAPKGLFLLLPVFALLLQALCWGRFYIEHLVFALYSHAYVFLLLLLGLAGLPGWILRMVGLLILWLMLQRVYEGSAWRTTAKLLALLFLYGLALGFGMVGTLIAALLLM